MPNDEIRYTADLTVSFQIDQIVLAALARVGVSGFGKFHRNVESRMAHDYHVSWKEPCNACRREAGEILEFDVSA